MSSITVRNLDEAVKNSLRARAAQANPAFHKALCDGAQNNSWARPTV